jgi:non-specific protein-tyrosine kinase
MVVALGGAEVYLSRTHKQYSADAQLLVTPVSQGSDATIGLGLIEASNDPTRDVTTASQFLTTPTVASGVIARLRLKTTPQALLGQVSAQPVAQSSIVEVTAKASSPRSAAAIADAFAQVLVAQRTSQLHTQIAQELPLLKRQLASLSPAEAVASTLSARIATMQTLASTSDPTLRQTVFATIPTSPSSPKPKLTFAAAILAGLIIGFGAAFMLQSIDPRIRREEQLRTILRVPVLARIPNQPNRRAGALAPAALTGAGLEAYRTLRSTLAAAHASELHPRSVLVTGSSPSEGKSTTAINLAHALVQSGNRVILIEADFHQPTVGLALGIRPLHGLGGVLVRQVSLEEALVTTEEYGPDLQLLLVERAGVDMADRLSLPTARQLVADAQALADFVVIDSPPLTEVGDTLSLAQDVGDIIVVVRLGRTKIRKLGELGELLGNYHLQPTGVALVGVERSRTTSYYSTDRSPDAGRRQAASA